MPRVSREQAALNRAALVTAAAELLCARGSAGVTIDAVSARAGLTHGGFYKQFASRDALMAEALDQVVLRRRVVLGSASAAPDPRRAVIEAYLSARHRDDPSHGCPVAALAGDPAIFSDAPLFDGFNEAFSDLVEAVRVPPGDGRALLDVAAMVGALQLSRTMAGTASSDEVLSATKRLLLG